jgi:hypothetical protein
MMIEQHIQQLMDDDPAKRRAAIIALGRTGDPQVLDALADTANSDPDPELRDLAMKAQRYIHKKQTESVTATSGSTITALIAQPTAGSDGASPEEIVVTPPPPRKELTYRERQLAKGYLDQAIGFRISGEPDKALDALVAAVRTNPELAEDSLAYNLAPELTGIGDNDEAMAHVLHLAREPKKTGRGGKAGKVSFSSNDMLILVLELVILFAVSVVFAMILENMFSRLFDSGVAARGSARLSNPFKGMTNQQLILNAASYALASTMTTMLGNVIVYTVGTFMGGVGEVPKVLSAMLSVQIVTNILAVAAFAILQANAAGFSRLMTATSRSASTAAAQALGGPLLLAGGLIFLAGFGGWIAMAVLIARAHQVNVFKGFAIVFIGGIAQSCIFSLLGNALYGNLIPQF